MRKAAQQPKSSDISAIFSASAASRLGNGEALRRRSERLDAAGKQQQAPPLLAALLKVMNFDERRLALLDAFIEQIVETYDPDAIDTFLCWKADPVLDTILLLSARLDEESRYEVLHLAEDLARETGAGAASRA